MAAVAVAVAVVEVVGTPEEVDGGVEAGSERIQIHIRDMAVGMRAVACRKVAAEAEHYC